MRKFYLIYENPRHCLGNGIKRAEYGKGQTLSAQLENNNIFFKEYKLYLPTKEELLAEINKI